MLLSSRNCSVIRFTPGPETAVIAVRPEICANCRSSGAETSSATVSGEAPGSCVLTSMVGKSTSGREETGRRR